MGPPAAAAFPPTPLGVGAGEASAGSARRRPWRVWLVVVALGGLPSLSSWLAPADLELQDQAKVALYVLSVLDGEWLLPRAQGAPATKPPLYPWLAAVASLPSGPGDASVRAPSVVAMLGVALLGFALGRRLYGTSAALIGVALLATTVHVSKLAYFARSDMLLSLWVALAFAAYAAGRSAVFWLALALGTLTKGPVGFAIPLAGVALDAAFRRDLDGIRSLRPGRGLCLLAALVALWAAPVWLHHADEVRRVMIQRELVDRIAGAGAQAQAKHHPPCYLIPYLVLRLLPWSPLIPLGWALREARRAGQLLGGWLLGGLVIVSLPAAKRPDYLMPLYPAAALLAAAFLERWSRGAVEGRLGRATGALVRAWGAVVALAVAGLPALALARAGLPPSAWSWIAAGAAIAPLVLALAPRRSPRARLGAALAAQALMLLAYPQAFSAAARTPDREIVEAFARDVRAAAGDEPVDFHRAGCASLNFALRRNVADVSLAELERRARCGKGGWLVMGSEAHGRLREDPERGAWLEGLALVASSGPRSKEGHDGERLLLLRFPPEPSLAEPGRCAAGALR
jgi:4-amino-4-deoxy-L-arabinose transferase-like glycosyltransferase